MKAYSKDLKALIFFKERATPEFWDKQWTCESYYQHLIKYKNLRFVKFYAQKYLPEGARVLEGGCGKCEKLYTLHNNNYQAYGVDFAQKTLMNIKNAMPELKLIIGNVESLMFKDMSFDGYWSFGVIEHFWDGYDRIAHEMNRVLKTNGYLFLAFPQMSYLRKIKVLLNLYTQLNKDKESDKETFYQFALDRKLVIEEFRMLGFREVYVAAISGLKGLIDEMNFLKSLLQRLYDYEGRSIIIQGTRFFLDNILAPLTGHSAFIIFEKDRHLGIQSANCTDSWKMKPELEYINCPLCGCDQSTYLYKKPDTRFFLSPIEFKVVKCKNCAVGYVNPRPTPKNIKKFYPDEFYNKRGMKNTFNLRRYSVQAKYFKDLPKGSKILDVGCATGSFAKYLSDTFGFDTYGTDLVKPKTLDHDPTKLKFGIISDLDYPNGFFDAIAAWAVFEHLHDPMNYFITVSRLLKPGGRFVFLVTNLNGLFSRLTYSEDIPRHLIFYTKKSLEFCARQAGLTLKRLEYSNEIYKGEGFPMLQRRFLLMCGADWKQIMKYKGLSRPEQLPPALNIIAKLLLGLGFVLIPPKLETFLRISGIMVGTMTKNP